MRQRLADYQVFWREFRQTFHTTGSVLPSGAALARALASRVVPSDEPRRILEAGPGTGAVTGHILQRLGPEDQLDLVELNDRFADVLRTRLENDAQWREASDRVRVLNMPLEQLEASGQYSAIVSGLPLSNFSCDAVEAIFAQFHRLAAAGAMLSFFEYVAIRKAKALWSKRRERHRLAGIDRIFLREFERWETGRQCVSANVPPAWVHHLQLPGSPEPRSSKLVDAVR
jgi:phospholipid N-methyltransferase